ncbi:hypothetical protein AUR04nite_07970 [Glutamicibacter uratoxydans]|uniref:Small multidrug efflux protein n=1 Tax=Glutamicibacter uratoxydans TaxID=43667 RepID=A0A4Y4DNM7_GLUUR|nr:small multi-drug export protein [Glutamicibacter uratoxydans]GED05265.1 hypothetical protein AUR04nite_07970 [Glutamicibacter uratoxydans]
MIESLQAFAASFPEPLQWLAVALVSAIPLVESYFGAVIGVVLGLPVAVGIAVAVLGNVVSMLLFVNSAHAVRSKVRAGKEEPEQRKHEKLHRAFDKFGIAGVSLIGQTMLPSQITSAALVSFGANKQKVIFWQIISIILWGTIFGLLASAGIPLLTR